MGRTSLAQYIFLHKLCPPHFKGSAGGFELGRKIGLAVAGQHAAIHGHGLPMDMVIGPTTAGALACTCTCT